MLKQLTLNFSGFHIQGTADVTLWGGGKACIQMSPFKVKSLETEEILKGINDAGFGVESINGAACDVFENFEGHLVFQKTLVVGKVSEHTLDCHNCVV